MEPIEYARMAAVEETMWWYRALHRNLSNALARFLTKRDGQLLDAGCGTGGFILYLKSAMPSLTVYGIDAAAEACLIAWERGSGKIGQASVNQLPFDAASFDGIVSADVLYHREAEPEKAMTEFRRCLRPGGTLVLQLPAYEWLRSYHDEQVHTRHRFNRSEVIDLFEKGGFSVDWASYWNCLAFPLLLLRRFILRPGKEQSDVQNYSRPVESIMSTLMSWEESHLKRGGRFGWGSSILVVGHKKS